MKKITEKNIEVNKWNSAYSRHGFKHKNKYPSEDIVRFVTQTYGNVDKKEKIRILDLGCGYGNNLKFLRNEGYDYVGIDFSIEAIKHCRAENLCVIYGNIVNLDFPDNYFDCIIDRMTIQHNSKERIEKIVQEIKRVLKPKGIFFSCYNKNIIDKFLTTFLTKKELKKLFPNSQIENNSFTSDNGKKKWEYYTIKYKKNDHA